MNTAFPEYHAAGAAGFRLLVSIKVANRSAAQYLQDRLHTAAGTVRIFPVAEHWLLTVRAELSGVDRLLIEIAAEVDAVNRLSAMAAGAELIENRLVPVVDSADEASPAEQIGLALEAGNTFGTGRHPSTRLACLALSEIRDRQVLFPAAVLDIGCGSGILALVSARLGARRVLGIDIAGEAVAQARCNVDSNNLSHLITISDQPFDRITSGFDLVIANLTASVLLRLAPQFAGRLNPGGWLIVAGIQGRQADEVAALLGRSGLVTIKDYASGPWRAGLCRLER